MLNATTAGSRRLSAIFVAAIAAFAFATAMLATSSPAQAQLPAICDQYPDNEICIGPTDEEDSNGGVPGTEGNEGANPDGTGDVGGSGTLPFTGYPVSALVLLMLILLIAGLAIRAYLAARDRIRSAHGTSGLD